MFIYNTHDNSKFISSQCCMIIFCDNMILFYMLSLLTLLNQINKSKKRKRHSHNTPVTLLEFGVAKVKCLMPIIVNVAVYAMRFATAQELPRGLSFEVVIGGRKRGSGQKFGVVYMACSQVRGAKV